MILDILKADSALLTTLPGQSNRSDTSVVLRSICMDVENFDRDLYDLTQNMIDTMLALNSEGHPQGVGLAAPQIGVGLNFFVMRTENGMKNDTREALVIINPKVTMDGETYQDIEGCLSIPGLLGRVTRYKELAYTAINSEGTPSTGSLSGFSARIFQHELDHLNGVLFVDRADKFYRPIAK